MYQHQNQRRSPGIGENEGGFTLTPRDAISVAYQGLLDRQLTDERHKPSGSSFESIQRTVTDELVQLCVRRSRFPIQVVQADLAFEFRETVLSTTPSGKDVIATLVFAKSREGCFLVIEDNGAYQVQHGEIGIAVVQPVVMSANADGRLIRPLYSRLAFNDELKGLVGTTDEGFQEAAPRSHLLCRIVECVQAETMRNDYGYLWNWIIEDHEEGIVLVADMTNGRFVFQPIFDPCSSDLRLVSVSDDNR